MGVSTIACFTFKLRLLISFAALCRLQHCCYFQTTVANTGLLIFIATSSVAIFAVVIFGFAWTEKPTAVA